MFVQVQAPTYFMKWLGINSLTVNDTGTATRRNLVLELVLDKSASMGTRDTAVGTIPASINSSSSSCEAMVYSAIQFLQYFSPYDYLGEISFNYTVYDDYTASTNYWESGGSGMANSIANIQCGEQHQHHRGVVQGLPGHQDRQPEAGAECHRPVHRRRAERGERDVPGADQGGLAYERGARACTPANGFSSSVATNG